MKDVKLLDCTLRDGGYLIDKEFGETVIRGLIDSLIRARIDIIEIGFFQDEGFGAGKTVYRNNADASRYIPKEHGETQFAVLADYSRFSIDNLDVNIKSGVEIVRACFFKNERFDAIPFMREVKEKGYKLFVQPVDILGYSDAELIEFIGLVNEIEPECFSIVDTFGSMYEEDLRHVYDLIDHNLVSSAGIGFHSHNNLQMSSALSQVFVRMSHGHRRGVVDATVSGMGRGAGNTPTELIAQYMVSKWNGYYDIDAILDSIDSYIDGIRARCTWGYNTSYFVAGSYGAHVNNINYLLQKNGIQHKDLRYILNKIGEEPRKRYHYDLLEQTYLEYLGSDIDDVENINKLRSDLTHKNIVILAPGRSVLDNQNIIGNYITDNHAVVIKINFMSEGIKSDYLYFSNARRYQYWKNVPGFESEQKIVASNIVSNGVNEIKVNANRLIKCGSWDGIDNSTLMLLRLMDYLDVQSIAIAGLDGYSSETSNYLYRDLEVPGQFENPGKMNAEIADMLLDYLKTRKSNCKIHFLTESRFETVLREV